MIFRNFPKKIQFPTVVSIGNFDGFHLGHQKLIAKNVSFALENNLKSCVILFEKQPKEFLFKDKAPKRLFNLRTKIHKLLDMQIDYICIFNFNLKFSQQDSKSFIDKLLTNLSMKALFVGEDFRFGFRKGGDIQFIRDNYPNIFLSVIPDLYINYQKLSSSLLRDFLIKNQFQKSCEIMGNDYCLYGKVIHGNKLARTFNTPTANILIKNQNIVLNGVYLVLVEYQNRKLPSIAHIGTRPTVENTQKIFLEVHILNFNENLYGKELKVSFSKFFRNILKFENLNELKEAIKRDIAFALEYWNHNKI